MAGKKRSSRRWTRLIGGLLGSGIVWGFYVSRTSDKEIGAASLHEAKRLFEYTELLPSDEGEIVRHTYYTLSFNSRHKQANWVYYILGSEGKERVAERTDRFREDKKVPSGSAKPSDYTKSGYDRGHLCPAADMTHSAEAMEETFLMSNISPQLPVFNRGIWKSLEKQVRDWGEKERIYIVTGPVFKDNKGKIGRTGVTVPGFFYKVVYAPGARQMIAFVLPNTQEKRQLRDYAVTVDSVERLTNIDFFPQLSDTLENRLEAAVNYDSWR